MANIQELFEQLGMSPNTIGAGPGSVSEVQAVNPLARRRRQQLDLERILGPSPRQGGMVFDPATVRGVAPAGGDDGVSIGDIVGKVFGGAIEAVDQGRAWVGSAAKEANDAWANSGLARELGTNGPDWLINQRTDEEYDQHLKDIGAEGGFEMDDLRDQAWANKGFGDYVSQINGQGGSIKNKLLGFAGDVASDPLTYVSMGGATVARGSAQGVNQGIRTAVRSGGRREIADQLARTALEGGLASEKGVQKLVAEAGRRGRGALTTKGLRRAGVDAAQAEKLGLPSLSREFLGLTVPGGAKVANVVEDSKGAFKAWLGDTATAKWGRTLRISDRLGEKRLVDIVRSASTPDEKAMLATVLLGVNNAAKAEGHGWGNRWAAQASKDLKGLRKIDAPEGINLTDLLETGAHQSDDMAVSVRNMLDTMGAEMREMGIEMGDISNYVPHLSTRAARKAAATNPEVAKFVREIGDNRFFQNERQLMVGETFMGEPILEGTIKELNEKSQRLLGFKMFEDDIREILPVYMASAQAAAVDASVRKGMLDAGIAKEQVDKHFLSPAQQADLEVAEKAAKEAWDAQTVKLSDGTTVRHDALKGAVSELKQLKKNALGRLEELRAIQVRVNRDRTMWSKRVQKLSAEIPHLESEIAFLRPQAAKLRGAQRRAAEAKIARLTKALEVKTTEFDALSNRLKKLPKPNVENVEPGTIIARQAVEASGREVDDLTTEVARLQADSDLLLQANTPIGGAPQVSPVEQTIADRQGMVETLSKQITQDEDAVMGAAWHQVEMADKIAIAERQLDDLDRALKAGQAGRRDLKKAADHASVRQHTHDVLDAVKAAEQSGNPAFVALADAELRATMADMAALRAGKKAVQAQDLVRTMQDPKFGEVIKGQLDAGYGDVGGGLQAPGWVEEAYRVEHMLQDPKFLPAFADAWKWFTNQWKGYATMRPGFVTRNAYSSLFSFYLEAGSRKAVQSATSDFKKFYRIYKKFPDNYMERALAVKGWDQEMVTQLDDALKVVGGTGGGLAPSEVATNVFKGKNANPFSQNFVGIRATKAANENVEAVIRGAHAYDVLRRGGDVSTAMDTVTKWHFNYRDITKFDRTMKQIVPFWTFFSRNTALQAQVWTHNLPALNRTYFNLKRNMGLGEPEEQNAPGWMTAGAPLPLDINPEGESRYLMADVGPTQFMKDMQNLGDPRKMVAGMGLTPAIGLPLQAVAGKNLFTNRPNEDMVAPGPLFGAGLQALGLGSETGSGGVAISQMQKDMLNGLLPGFATPNRLVDGNRDDPLWSWLGYLGASTQKVTPRQRRGVAYGKQAAKTAAREKREQLAKL